MSREHGAVTDLPASASATRALLREQRYRRYFLAADGKQAAVVMVVVSLAIYATMRNDFVLLRGTSDLPVVVAIKLVHLVVTVAALVQLGRARLPRQQDVAVASWLAVTAVSIMHISTTRLPSGEFQGPVVTQGALLCVLYFALRGPVWHRAIAAVLIVAGTLLVAWNPLAEISSVGRVSGTISLLGLNIVGVISARAFEEQRRRRVQAEHQDQCLQQTLALKNRELAAEKERVEDLSRARTTFLATMSHEFRTPMNAVIGLSSLLIDAPLAAPQREQIRVIHESARSLLALLNDILDFAKIDARKLTLCPTAFDLRGLAVSVGEMMQPAAAARAIRLFVDVDPALPAELVCDDARLRQVLVNLVSNAIKFTEQGEVRLRVTARALPGGQHAVDIKVEDTGSGIAPEAQARLFQPFVQADAGIERRYGGTGLGLAISQQIVMAMGSEIHVRSELGRGSEFSFSLRLAQGEPLAEPRPTEASGTERAVEPPPLAILVVDDQPINRMVARAMLDRLGYRVDVASDGMEAIAAAARVAYDVIFMDLHMPGMNGLETTVRIREQLAGKPRGPHVIALTASVFDEDREACLAAGMHDFIGKPLELEHIQTALRRRQATVTTDAPVAPAADGASEA